MDEESYIISFFPGTSGKLIAQVLWRMINGIDEEILFTPQNSAHVSYPWETSWSHPLTKDPNVAGPNMFDELSFQSKGILATQMFPNFDVLADKLPNTKVIVIQVEEQDLKEIAFNHITKNSMVSANYKKKAEERGYILDDDFWDNVLKERQIDLIRWYKLNQDDTDLYRNFSKYYRVSIPEQYLDKALIIKYNEIYKPQEDSFVALQKLEDFVGRKAGKLVSASYTTYVENRNKLWNK